MSFYSGFLGGDAAQRSISVIEYSRTLAINIAGKCWHLDKIMPTHFGQWKILFKASC